MPISPSKSFHVVLVSLGFLFLINCTVVKLPPLASSRKLNEPPRLVEFHTVQPILNSRCVVCHSCMESPCQANMQSFDGLKRGAFHRNVYDGLRVEAVAPTRLYEDAKTEKEWRDKGFTDILAGKEDSLLISVLRLTGLRKSEPKVSARDSLACYRTQKEIPTKGSEVSQLSMPYGLPALSPQENDLIMDWVAGGAPGKTETTLSTKSLAKNSRAQIKQWENYLNLPDLNSRVTARYLFEHLFLAHFYFKESPREFLKLVRSKTACEQEVTPVSTRRPTDDPGVQKFYYCFYKDPTVVVFKNHLPYELSAKKLTWIKNNFSSPKWKATELPSYSSQAAANPLMAFAEMPVIARYRFLLEDAQYQVMSFIKGPVCNGSFAVNVIQEQFFVFFTQPESDLMVVDKEYAKKASEDVLLPGSLGSNPSTGMIVTGYRGILEHRARARADKNKALQAHFAQGFPLEHIWDGGGTNDNAVLTVFRHFDNAKVVKGAKGDLSKTAFVLSYSVFERLVYNLVINFDVFGNVTHQTLTRLYMDLLRMEAEDNFLMFLPETDRVKIKDQWYQGWLTKWKIQMMDEKKFAKIPAKIQFPVAVDSKKYFVEKILFDRLNARVRGENDNLNWKVITPSVTKTKQLDPVETELRKLTSLSKVKDKVHFSSMFHDFSVLVVRNEDRSVNLFSIIHNREHSNVAWILDEDNRYVSDEDTLTILPGIQGSYPNQFFAVNRKDIPQFVQNVLALTKGKQYKDLINTYGIKRMDPEIWRVSDLLNFELQRLQAVEAGILDLSRYSLAL